VYKEERERERERKRERELEKIIDSDLQTI
jgi:hypothetical protein